MFKFLCATLILTSSMALQASNLTLLTDRPTATLQPIVDEFRLATGHKVKIVEMPYADIKAALKAKNPADLVMVKDMLYLTEFAASGYFKPLLNRSVAQRVDFPEMNHASGLWTAVSYRVRGLAFDKRTANAALQSIDDLSQLTPQDALCLRSGKSSYNEALFSHTLLAKGMESTQSLLSKILKIRKQIYKNDTSLLEDIESQNCRYGIVNHYYLAQLHAQGKAMNVGFKPLKISDNEIHSNGTAVAVAKSTTDQAAAEQFIELMLTDVIQEYWAQKSFELPIRKSLSAHPSAETIRFYPESRYSWTQISKQVNSTRNLFKTLGYE